MLCGIEHGQESACSSHLKSLVLETSENLPTGLLLLLAFLTGFESMMDCFLYHTIGC